MSYFIHIGEIQKKTKDMLGEAIIPYTIEKINNNLYALHAYQIKGEDNVLYVSESSMADRWLYDIYTKNSYHRKDKLKVDNKLPLLIDISFKFLR